MEALHLMENEMNEHDLTAYRGFIAERDQEIELLRQALVRYGDRPRMSNAEPSELQQAIDRAFEVVEKKTPDEWLADEQISVVAVIDPDGWDRKNIAEDWAVPLTLNEFSERLASSTVNIKLEKLKPLKEARAASQGGQTSE